MSRIMRDTYETTPEQHEESERRYDGERYAESERHSTPRVTTSFASVALIREAHEAEAPLAYVFASAPTRAEISAELRRGPTSRLSLAMGIVMRRLEALSASEARIEQREP